MAHQLQHEAVHLDLHGGVVLEDIEVVVVLLLRRRRFAASAAVT